MQPLNFSFQTFKSSAFVFSFSFFSFFSGVFSQGSTKFVDKFTRAKNFLAQNETAAALPIFEELNKTDPSNSNINYLLGICYTEEIARSPKSIYHLEKAIKDIAVDYDGISANEKRAPIFVHYYLTIAYSQNGKCKEAKQAKNYFHTLYGIEKNDYYISDAEKWVKRCNEQSATENQSTAKNQIITKDSIITKNVDYTLRAPLYGVQVGALSRLAPVSEFAGLKNVEAFLDNSGMIRYVIGHFIFKRQAETLLKTVMAAGYRDAFIVDVNKEKKFSEEVVIVNNVSIYNDKTEKATFKVQIGAFRDSIPGELTQLYLKIEGIEESEQNDLTIFSSGNFSSYEEAEKHKRELRELGIPDAFIVAYSRNKKIDVKLARNFYKK